MGHLPFPTEMYPPLVGHNIHRLNSPLNMIGVQYQLHYCYSTIRPQGQNVVQREVVSVLRDKMWFKEKLSGQSIYRSIRSKKHRP